MLEGGLRERALDVVRALDLVREERERIYPPRIEVVWVLSGPGTCTKRLLEGDVEWGEWMDKDRIRAGIAVVREVTATMTGKSAKEVTRDDIADHGPVFFYNGIAEENKALREELEAERCLLPEEKVVIVGRFCEEDGSFQEIRHTGDQARSLRQELNDSKSRLYRMRGVAVVANIPDFIRIPFYLNLYEDMKEVEYWFYGLRSRDKRIRRKHTRSELRKLRRYVRKGDVVREPVGFEV